MPFVFYLDAPSNVNERPAVIALTLTHTSPVAWEGAVRADDKHVIDVLVTHEEVAHDAPAAYADCHNRIGDDARALCPLDDVPSSMRACVRAWVRGGRVTKEKGGVGVQLTKGCPGRWDQARFPPSRCMFHGNRMSLTVVWSAKKNPIPKMVMLIALPDRGMLMGVTIVTTKESVGAGVTETTPIGDGVGSEVGDGVGDGVGSGVGDGVGLRSHPACPSSPTGALTVI